MAASPSSTSTSSSVVVLTTEDLLDTASSANPDSRPRSWPEASRARSTFVVNQPLQSIQYQIPEHYALLNAKDWAACDVPPEGYNAVCVYAAAFEAGMRLPFHDLHAAVLRHYGLAPSQLMPNAWRYLNAFVLLCDTAGVEPMLPVFLFFFFLCKDKGEAMGRYHFRPYRLPPPDSGSQPHGRLFTGKMPQSSMWKDCFFFVRGPSWAPWPCSLKWGTPSMASIKRPVPTSDTTEAKAIHALLHLAGSSGSTGVDIIKFLSGRNPPVGHLQIPAAAATPQYCAAVKQEAAAAWTEQTTRKRKSPEPITSLPPLPLHLRVGSGTSSYDDDRWTVESPPASAGAGVGLGHEEEPGVTTGDGDEPSDSWLLLHFAQLVTAGLKDKKQELQMVRAEVMLLQEQLAEAKARHANDMAQLVDELQKANDKAGSYAEELQKANDKASRSAEELQKANDKASRYAEELQKAKAEVRHIKTKHGREQMELEREKNRMVRDAYDKGVRNTGEYMVNLYGDRDTINLSEFTKEIESLLSACSGSSSSPPPAPAPGPELLDPQAPVDDK